MGTVFNSTFEVSLRLLLLLSESDDTGLSIDRIATYDFVTTYSRYFGLSDSVLHGENEFGYSEIASRRNKAQAAIKELVLDGFVQVVRSEEGYKYCITENGKKVSSNMESEYATAYRELAKLTIEKFNKIAETEIMDVISKASVQFLRR